MAKKDYIRVQYAQPHPQRTRKMLKAHPELSKLVGCDPRTFFYLLLIVGMQLAIAAFIGNYPWWAMIVIAWTVGAVANHACFVQLNRHQSPSDPGNGDGEDDNNESKSLQKEKRRAYYK